MALTQEDQYIVSKAGMGKKAGFGKKPALLIIDMQVYMAGDKREPIEESVKTYPTSCGEMSWAAMDQIRLLIDACHRSSFPVVYTRQTIQPDLSDAGLFGMKMELKFIENLFFKGTHGWEIAPGIAPEKRDYVIDKSRPSAFFGTPLTTYLIGKQVDTVIVTGGSTSNCVRATVFDSASYGYRTIVASDCLTDRQPASHEVNLRDMGRQYADVMTTAEILQELAKLG